MFILVGLIQVQDIETIHIDVMGGLN